MKPKSESMQISAELYQDLVDHLTVHAPSDAWAKSCLDRLTKEAIAVHSSKFKLKSGTYVIGESEASYN